MKTPFVLLSFGCVAWIFTTGAEPSLPRTCKVIALKNGHVLPDNRTTVNIGEVVKYVCNRGFKLRGPRSRKCLATRHPRLKGNIPKCKDRDECRKKRCAEFSKCINTPGSYYCVCNDGYEGDGATCTKRTATTVVIPTPPPGCFYNGKSYPFGTVIESGQSGNWCYWTICDEDGNIINADNFNCLTTVSVLTTTPQAPQGCLYNGKIYPRGTTIESGRSGKWCYWTMCGESGQVITGDNFHCVTTPPPTTVTPTPREGCFYNGKIHPPGTVIESGRSGDWCYWTLCDGDSEIVTADDLVCASTSTTSPTTPPGCYYNGQHYSPGATIESGQSGNWCYKTICDENGQILSGDNFECSTTSSSTTTSTPDPTHPE